MSLRDHPAVIRFAQAARAYCQLVESAGRGPESWAEDVLAALAELYAAALRLPEPEEESGRVPESFDVIDAEWQQRYADLGQQLGPARWYRCYFDPTEPPRPRDETVVGDLADDLADVYREVRPGLRAWDAGRGDYVGEAVSAWRGCLFGSHWGVHAVGALRALHPLVFLRGLGGR